MTPQEYQARIARAQALMYQAGLDAILLATGPNLFYFTGRSGTRPYILILPQSGEPVFIVHQARQYEVRQ